MSTTLVLSAAEIDSLREALEEARYEFRPLDHAHFQARGEEVVVSAYRSGKVVVQGKGAPRFFERYGGGPGAPAAVVETHAGSDESGKGDYFGPLVVAAVVVTPETAPQLAKAGVRDCKTMGDLVVLKAAKAIRDLCPHAVVSLSAPEYNARHEAEKNVSLFLATMHAQALAAAMRGAPACDRVVIDQFTAPERLERALKKEGVNLPMEIRPRAEDDPAVAAASVLARAEFLIGLREAGNDFGVELPKGAGDPVDRVARSLYRAGGMKALEAVAKVHFKTTQKAIGGAP